MAVEKIAVFIHSLSGGGAERCVSRLLEQWSLSAPDVEVHLVLNEPHLAYPLPESAHVHLLGNASSRYAVTARGLGTRFVGAVRLLERVKPDAVLAFMPWSNLLAVAARGRSRHKPRLVLSERTSYASNTGHGVKGPVVRAAIRHVYGRADALIAVSQGLAAEVQQIGNFAPGFVRAIPNGIDVSALNATADISEKPLHPWLRASRDTPVVVYAGRLEPVKGADLLLEAWHELLRWSRAKLLILGQGNSRDALEKQAAELPDGGASVDFLPFQANPFAFIKQADVFVLPSRREGFPNSLLEAMALGRPCVAFDCPTGPRELLGESQHGLLVPRDNSHELASALRRLLKDSNERQRLGEVARERAESFSTEQMAQAYLDVLLPGRRHV